MIVAICCFGLLVCDVFCLFCFELRVSFVCMLYGLGWFELV